jgi:hypothetical protein
MVDRLVESPLRFRWRPVHFRVPAAVVAQEAVAGFATGIGQGDEGNGRLVVWTGRLFVEEMRLRHQGDGGYIPRRLVFLLTGNLLDSVTTFAGSFIRLDAGAMQSMIGHGHRSAAARFQASQMLMLKGFDESKMSFSFMFRFHRHSSLS